MASPKLTVLRTDPPASPPAPKPVIALVLFGRDEAGKPHAASFLDTDKDAARAAAQTMSLRSASVDSDAARHIAGELAVGRLFPSGKAFVPFVKATLYAELLAALGEADDAPQEASAEEEHEKLAPALYDYTGYRLPRGWGEIKLGSLVLATVGPQEGWYEALITEAKDDGLFVLKWRDWPDEPPFLRRAHQLALLPGGAVTAAT